MNTFINNMADLLSGLYNYFGTIGGALIFVAIGVLASYPVIKSRCDNVFIAKHIGSKYVELKRKKKDNDAATLITKNGYIVLGVVYVSLFKLIFGLIFAYTIRTEILSYHDFSFAPLPIREYGYSILSTPDSNRTKLLFFAILFDWIQSICNKMLIKESIVDTGRMDFIVSGALFVISLIVPVGFLFYLLAFTVIELIIIIINLSFLREYNTKRISKRKIK